MARQLGGHLVAKVLQAEGVRHVFCVPGESYLSVLDGLYDTDIQVVATRHEGGASFMSEAYAKASGRVGVCMATRAVGVANLAIGLHTARQDSTPVVALLGHIERPFRYREAFQEVDLAAWLSHICKWTVEIDDARRIPELVRRAFHVAQSGRPGPVAVALPHDMLEDQADAAPIAPTRIPVPVPDPAQVDGVLTRLLSARRPLVLVGGGVLRAGATELLVQLAERLSLPVVTAFRRYDAFPNEHRCYAGWLGFGPAPSVRDAFREADLVLALGTRLSQVTTQDYTLPLRPETCIHVDVDPALFHQVTPASETVLADARAFLAALLERLEARGDGAKAGAGATGGTPSTPIAAVQASGAHATDGAAAVADTEGVRRDRAAWVQALHEAYLRFSTPDASDTGRDGALHLDAFMHHFNEVFPADTVITSDAGNFFGWLARYRRFAQPGTYIGPTSGAMGYGLPAAIGAKLARPEATVVSFSGDGGFMMTVAELETAVRMRAPVLAIVVNNRLYGTIRAHQERHFPGRVIGTELGSPDFARLAETMGARGYRVERVIDMRLVLEEAYAAVRGGEVPVVLEVVTDPAVLTVGQKPGDTSRR